MVYVAVLLAIVVGVLLGYLMGHRGQGDRSLLLDECRGLRAEVSAKTSELGEARQTIARLEERLGATALAKEELDRSIEYVHSLLEAKVSTAMQSYTDELATRAEKTFSATAKTSFEHLVQPVDEELKRLNTELRDLQDNRREQFGALGKSLEDLMTIHLPQLRAQTDSLVKALRQPTVRGGWGEVQLRRVIELAGMTRYCDFEEQPTLSDDTGRSRPDVVIHLPGNRCIAVDAKAPLDAFLRMTEAETDEERLTLRAAHAHQLQVMVHDLASRRYGERLHNSLDFVVLFLPGEAFLSEALAAQPSLLEEAFTQSVIIASPTTLLPLLKAVAFGWRSEALEQNAAQIAAIGRDLYQRLSTFRDHLARMGGGLSSAVKAYNDGVGSLDRRVLPSARRFLDHGVEGREGELEELDTVSDSLRLVEPAVIPSEHSEHQ
ncbi:DNA recombination protein RmuC [Ferrimicrobium sp.]|uniref:DNA recombination protein RmuC n=1 Tax=Ferrimicrobium sp. TaxID=2926050 RepID=UPI00262D7212|nr:DNA recombination protein RmuC [Ferrimicrobium sp.]